VDTPASIDYIRAARRIVPACLEEEGEYRGVPGAPISQIPQSGTSPGGPSPTGELTGLQ